MGQAEGLPPRDLELSLQRVSSDSLTHSEIIPCSKGGKSVTKTQASSCILFITEPLLNCHLSKPDFKNWLGLQSLLAQGQGRACRGGRNLQPCLLQGDTVKPLCLERFEF